VNNALGQPQSVLVLGGGSEIARALTRRLVAARTRTVVLAGRAGSASMARTEAEAREGGASVRSVELEATDPASVAAAVERAFDGGDIDLVVLAFGVLGDQLATEADPLRAVETATVNYTASVVAGLAVAKHLQRQGHGTLLVLSSVAGSRVRRANFVYGSSKAGMDGFFQGLGDALAGTGPRVVIVRPGFVRDRMTEGMEPAPLATDPETVADAIVRGLARGDDVVYVPAVLRWVTAVFRHLPHAVWRKVPG